MKESDINQALDNFIEKNTPDYGIRGRYENGEVKIIEKFKTMFEAQWWQINVVNPFGIDKDGNRLTGSLIVDLKRKDDA